MVDSFGAEWEFIRSIALAGFGTVTIATMQVLIEPFAIAVFKC